MNIRTLIDEEVGEVLGRLNSLLPVGNGVDLLLLSPLEDVLLRVELNAVNGTTETATEAKRLLVIFT